MKSWLRMRKGYRTGTRSGLNPKDGCNSSSKRRYCSGHEVVLVANHSSSVDRSANCFEFELGCAAE
eukprot:scaffold38580_cov31-Prasinocladus_malaysianus.AAC.2